MTSLDHIQYNPQVFGLVAKACASKLGYTLLKNRMRGRDCECDEVNLKYLLRAQHEISCYQAPGSISNQGVQNQSTLLFEEDTYGWVSASITSSNGELNGSVVGVYPNIEKAIAGLIAFYLDGTPYVSTYYLNPSGDIVFNIIAPDTVMCGVTYTIDIAPKDALHAHTIQSGTFGGGQCVVTEDDNCITVDQANQIMSNINEICGGLCENCTDFYQESEPIQ